MMRLRAGALTACLLLLSACAAARPIVPENAYVEQAKRFTLSGGEALQRERWDAALRAYARALKAAQLADDAALVGQAWYNLGAVLAAAGRKEAARKALAAAAAWSRRRQDTTTNLRARLRLALLAAGHGSMPTIPERMPADVHLMAGHLAHRQGLGTLAAREYALALRRPAKARAAALAQAQAHLGLAMLARQAGDMRAAKRQCGKALRLLRRWGAPRMTARALLFMAQLPIATALREDALKRAMGIYEALEDAKGRRQCRELLARLLAKGGA